MKEIIFKKFGEEEELKSLSIHPLLILPREGDRVYINSILYIVRNVLFDYDACYILIILNTL